MPGPVSDRYDPEWGTGDNGSQIENEIQKVYDKLSSILGNQEPIYILDLVKNQEMTEKLNASLTIKEWRILRFACERAKESI